MGRAQPIPATSLSQTFIVSSLIVLVLALVVASLALAGGLTLLRKYLAAGTRTLHPNAGRLHRGYCLCYIQLLPNPAMHIRPHRDNIIPRNHFHMGIRDRILSIHRDNSRTGSISHSEPEPSPTRHDISNQNLSHNKPTGKLELSS